MCYFFQGSRKELSYTFSGKFFIFILSFYCRTTPWRNSCRGDCRRFKPHPSFQTSHWSCFWQAAKHNFESGWSSSTRVCIAVCNAVTSCQSSGVQCHWHPKLSYQTCLGCYYGRGWVCILLWLSVYIFILTI